MLLPVKMVPWARTVQGPLPAIFRKEIPGSHRSWAGKGTRLYTRDLESRASYSTAH